MRKLGGYKSGHSELKNGQETVQTTGFLSRQMTRHRIQSILLCILLTLVLLTAGADQSLASTTDQVRNNGTEQVAAQAESDAGTIRVGWYQSVCFQTGKSDEAEKGGYC